MGEGSGRLCHNIDVALCLVIFFSDVLDHVTNYLLVLYEVAEVACLLLSLMWCFTVVLFCTNHPTNSEAA